MEKFLKIAIVDDEPGMIQLIRLACDQKYQVVGTAANGADAIELVKKTSPHVLIMDLHMPVMDGLTALKAITELKTTAVVMLTAETSLEAVRQAMALGAAHVMNKPFDAAQLVPAIESAWHHHQVVSALNDQANELRETLETRKLLEKAKGILMEQQGFTEEEAHRMIQKMSQDQGLPVKDVCRALIQVKMVLGGKAKTASRPKNAA
jgi:response regulator NasT